VVGGRGEGGSLTYFQDCMSIVKSSSTEKKIPVSPDPENDWKRMELILVDDRSPKLELISDGRV